MLTLWLMQVASWCSTFSLSICSSWVSRSTSGKSDGSTNCICKSWINQLNKYPHLQKHKNLNSKAKHKPRWFPLWAQSLLKASISEAWVLSCSWWDAMVACRSVSWFGPLLSLRRVSRSSSWRVWVSASVNCGLADPSCLRSSCNRAVCSAINLTHTPCRILWDWVWC